MITHSSEEVCEQLMNAEQTISFKPDTVQSYTTETTGKGKHKKTDTTFYYSGNATLSLFGSKIEMPQPWSLENNEHLTREYFVKEFRRSGFYKKLSEYAGMISNEDEALEN